MSALKKWIFSTLVLLAAVGLLELGARVWDAQSSFRARLQAAIRTLPSRDLGPGGLPPPATPHIGPGFLVRAPRDGPLLRQPHFDGGRLILEQQLEYVQTKVRPLPRAARSNPLLISLGGSAAFGFPYREQESYAAKLRRLLARDGWQVLNAAQPGNTSTGLLPIVDYAVRLYQPESLVILVGNNEWIHWDALMIRPVWHNDFILGQTIQHSYLATALVYWSLRGYKRYQQRFHDSKGRITGWQHALDNPLERFAPFEAREWWRIRDVYLRRLESNLIQMASQARKYGVRPLMLTMPFNYRLAPNFTHPQPQHFLPAVRGRVAHLLGQARRLMGEQGDHAAALQRIREALALDPHPPVLSYMEAACLEALGRLAEAEEVYERCRERMIGNLGSMVSVNATITRAARAAGAELVDIKEVFDDFEHAQGRYFNEELLADSCHPTPLGHTLIARALAKVIRKAKTP